MMIALSLSAWAALLTFGGFYALQSPRLVLCSAPAFLLWIVGVMLVAHDPVLSAFVVAGGFFGFFIATIEGGK